MRRVIQFQLADMAPSDADVLRRIEMPAHVMVAPRIRALLDEAAIRVARCAEPRGVVQQVSTAEFAAIYRGEGENAPATPLDMIYPLAEGLALFVGTIGDRPGEEIEKLFGIGDPALGMVLDAYASETTNRIAYALAAEFLAETRGGGRVLPYSPGYCGWHVSGQRALFEVIRPEDIGVTLRPSCLMTPLKSVSGVLVAGEAAIHRFRPTFAFCDECATLDCVPRMASVRR